MEEEKHTKKSSRFWIVLALALVCFLGLGFLLLLVVGGIIFAITGHQIPGEPAGFQTQVLEGEGEDKILVIKVHGIIAEQRFLGKIGESPEEIRAMLKEAAEDEKIKAVIFDIDSPGGTVAASDSIARYIREFRQKNQKPVLAYMNMVAASGGYYIAVACNEIMAHPTAITGSIGVIMQYFEVRDLLQDKLGVHPIVIKSGQYKDMASSFRELTEAEQKILREMIREMYERFLTVIQEGRPALNLSGKKLYLSSIPLTCQSDLNNHVIPEALREALRERGIAISEKATIASGDEGRWILEDGGEQYLLTATERTIEITGKASLRQIADGRIYSANQALDLGLIDQIGYYPDAIEKARKLGGIGESYRVITYQRRRSLFERLLDTEGLSQQEMVEYFLRHTAPSFYYLWHVGQ